jgi:PAS domain S-box-containing protein
MNPLKILIIEDNLGDFVLLEQMLMRLQELRKDIFHVESLSDGMNLLESQLFDIVLLDLTLPDSYGIESFKKINEASPSIPILILSGLSDKKFALEAVKQGAQDYLVKGEFEENLLEKSIIYSIQRKQDLQLVRHSEETYKLLFEYNPIPVFIWDATTLQIIKVNNAALNHYEYDENEFLSKTAFQLIDANDLKRFELQQQKAEKPDDFAGILKHFKKNNQEIQVESRIRNIIIDQKLCKMILANDITEKRKVQGEVSFQANVLKNVRDIIFVTDLQGKITYWNEGAADAFGYKANEISGNSFELLFPEIEKHKALKEHEEIIIKKIAQSEVKLITKQSSIIWVDLKATLLLDERENAIGVIRVGKDITQSKTDAVKQKETVATLNSIFDNVVQGIILLDPYKRIRAFNRTANRNAIALVGLELEIGKRFYDYLLPDMYAEFKSNFDNALIDKTIEYELCYKFDDCKHIWFSTNFNPIATEDGTAIGVCISMLNITEQRETDEKLRLQYREIEKTNEELDRFVYSASHDLRAPLTSILGLINLAKMESKEDATLLYMDMMEKSVKKLDGFINDIISYSRNTRLEVSKVKIPFRDVIDEIIENLKFIEDAEKIEWRIQINETREFFTDLSRFKIILSNLLSNAIRYHNYNQPHPWVEISIDSQADATIIKVSDNGSGIEQDKQDKIFDMFYRASEKSGGSGIGLYIVKEIMQKLDGEIKVDSTPGEGATFTLSFFHNK